ncbi:MAG: DUF6279 family lipoprotein [Rhodoferax sp.]
MQTSASCRFLSSRIIGGLLVLLLSVWLLSGCSLVRLGYQQLPDLSYWWVDSYLDLDDAQGTALRRDLAAVHDWHRRSELPLLAQWLASLHSQALQDVTPERLCQRVDELRPRLQALLDQAEPGFATLAAGLKPGQLLHLQQQLAKRRQKWREDWLDGSAAERLQRRVDRLIDRAENFYGPLDAPQRALLRSRVEASRLDLALAEAEMLRRQQDLQQTLQTMMRDGLSGERARAAIRQLQMRLTDSPHAGYREHIAQLTIENCQTFAALHNSSSSAQRQQLKETLQGFAADARALMPARR